jgi:hypothetical protein
MTPTQLSLRHLRTLHWTVDVVEHWNHHANIRVDLFDIIDIVALRGGETLGVQATSYSNMSARCRKIAEADATPALREAGWRLVVHGWQQKGKGERYILHERDVS